MKIEEINIRNIAIQYENAPIMPLSPTVSVDNPMKGLDDEFLAPTEGYVDHEGRWLTEEVKYADDKLV